MRSSSSQFHCHRTSNKMISIWPYQCPKHMAFTLSFSFVFKYNLESLLFTHTIKLQRTRLDCNRDLWGHLHSCDVRSWGSHILKSSIDRHGHTDRQLRNWDWGVVEICEWERFWAKVWLVIESLECGRVVALSTYEVHVIFNGGVINKARVNCIVWMDMSCSILKWGCLGFVVVQYWLHGVVSCFGWKRKRIILLNNWLKIIIFWCTVCCIHLLLYRLSCSNKYGFFKSILNQEQRWKKEKLGWVS